MVIYFTTNIGIHVPTPNFDKLFTDQALRCPAVRFWIYAMYGRLLYKLRAHDNWQRILFGKGKGRRPAKAPRLKLLVLFSRLEKSCRLIEQYRSAIWFECNLLDKFVFICTEVTKNWQLPEKRHEKYYQWRVGPNCEKESGCRIDIMGSAWIPFWQ